MTIESGLPGLLGSIADVYPVFQPDETGYPVISYRLLSQIEDETHDGRSGQVAYHYQFTAHHTEHLLCVQMGRDIADAVRGIVDGSLLGGLFIEHARITNSADLGYFPAWDAWQFSVDAFIHTRE